MKAMSNSLNILIPAKPHPLSWKFLFDQIAQHQEIDEYKKRRWKDSLEILKSELGNGFFETCTKHHPIYLKLFNAPWLLDELIDFAATLQQLKTYDSNYTILLSKLRPFRKCTEEGVAFVEAASIFLKNGFSVKFIEQEKRKTPDIQITNLENNENTFIEITKITDTAERRQISDEFRKLSNAFLFYGYDLPYSCQQLGHFADRELDAIIRKIHELKDIAATNRSFETYKDENISLAIAHPNHFDLLMKWCEENNQRKGINGLQVDFDDTDRILRQNKIYQKLKQIPSDQPGVLLMPVHYMYFFCMNPSFTVYSIQKEIRKYKHLCAVVFYANLGQYVHVLASI